MSEPAGEKCCRRNVDWGIVLHLPKIPEAHKSVQQSSVTAGAVPRVSPRLGHGLALTAHCAVIHYQTAASLPTGEGKEAAVSLPPGGGLHFRAGAGTYIKAPLCKGGLCFAAVNSAPPCLLLWEKVAHEV